MSDWAAQHAGVSTALAGLDSKCFRIAHSKELGLAC